MLLNPNPTPEQARAVGPRAVREHPLVWTRTGRPQVPAHRSHRRSIVGMDSRGRPRPARTNPQWATQPQFVLRHHWHVGDLVVWDNTGLLHRAMPYEPTSRRLMHRTTLVGEEAIA